MTNLRGHKMTLILGSVPDCCGSTPERDVPATGATSENVPESVLISALEEATNSSWRLVCSSLAAERGEPFRTCYLSKDVRDVLTLWRDWQRSKQYLPPAEPNSGIEPYDLYFCPESLVIDVDLFRPLESTPVDWIDRLLPP